MSFRICKTCNVLKPLDQENFYFQRKRQYFVPECKECIRSKSRARYASDPKFRERVKAQSSTPESRARKNAKRRERYASDQEYRERLSARNRDWRNNNPEYLQSVKAHRSTLEYRAKKNARRRERYAKDQEHRESIRTQQRNKRRDDHEYRERQNAKLRQRRADDPAYRERENARQRERWTKNPTFREFQLAKQKHKYHSDQEFREKRRIYERSPEVRARKNARNRERWTNNPEYKDRKLSRQKHKYHNDQEFKEKLRSYARRPEVRAKNNAWQKERWASNHAFREAQLAKQKDKYHNDPEYRQQQRDKARFRLYGLTKAEYDLKVEEQGGLCAICQKQAKPKLFVDHHHKSGQVRDLLCPNCNSGIGRFEERYELLEDAAEYLAQAWLTPQEIPTIEVKNLFARFEIPHWEAKSRDRKFRKEKNANLRQWYGISLSQYEWLLTKGNGVCWICLRPETLKRQKKAPYPESLYVDHDHTTGMIRGLLCNNCNSGLGYFDDNPEILKAAIAYLEKWDWLNFAGENS